NDVLSGALFLSQTVLDSNEGFLAKDIHQGLFGRFAALPDVYRRQAAGSCGQNGRRGHNRESRNDHETLEKHYRLPPNLDADSAETPRRPGHECGQTSRFGKSAMQIGLREVSFGLTGALVAPKG